jgi:hypothetical protein
MFGISPALIYIKDVEGNQAMLCRIRDIKREYGGPGQKSPDYRANV